MKKAKKLVSLLAALVIALSCLPMTAFAADETYTIKIYSGNAPQNNYGELQALDFIYTGCLAFKNYCERTPAAVSRLRFIPPASWAAHRKRCSSACRALCSA